MTSFRAEFAIRIAAAALPRSHRQRRLEEWQADLAGCTEVGISPHHVVVGAVVAAMSFRIATLENGSSMIERRRHTARLTLYAAWIVAALAWTWTFGTHLAVAGRNLGFTLASGNIIDATVPLFVTGIVAAALGAAFGYRSLRIFRDSNDTRRV